jgi:hypothetical protein
MGGGPLTDTRDDAAHLAAAINARLRERSRAEDLSWLK